MVLGAPTERDPLMFLLLAEGWAGCRSATACTHPVVLCFFNHPVSVSGQTALMYCQPRSLPAAWRTMARLALALALALIAAAGGC